MVVDGNIHEQVQRIWNPAGRKREVGERFLENLRAVSHIRTMKDTISSCLVHVVRAIVVVPLETLHLVSFRIAR